VSLCRQSLVASSTIIGQRNAPASILDGELFLVRHLLILKEVANNLDLAGGETQRQTGQGGVTGKYMLGCIQKSVADCQTRTDALASIFNRTTALLPDALFASLGMPRGYESMTDARHVSRSRCPSEGSTETHCPCPQEIDQDLKRACQHLISLCAKGPCEPLQEWVDRVRAFNTSRTVSPPMNPSGPVPLSEQDWARQSAAEELHAKFVESCERDLRAAMTKLRLYLEDNRTVSVLLTHVKEAVVDGYKGYSEVVSNMYAGALNGVVYSEESLKERLRVICDE